MASARAHLAIILAAIALLFVGITKATKLDDGNIWRDKRDIHRHQHLHPSLRARIRFNSYDRSFKHGQDSNTESWPDIIIPLRRIVQNDSVSVPIRHPNGEFETVSIPVTQTQYHGSVPVQDSGPYQRGSASGIQFTGTGSSLRASWNMTFPLSYRADQPSFQQGTNRPLDTKSSLAGRSGSLRGYTFWNVQNSSSTLPGISHRGNSDFTAARRDPQQTFPEDSQARTSAVHRGFLLSPSSPAHSRVAVSGASSGHVFSGSSESAERIPSPFSRPPSSSNRLPVDGTLSRNETQSSSLTAHQRFSNISLHRTSTDFLLRPSQSRTLNLVELYNSTRQSSIAHRTVRHHQFGTSEHVKDDLEKENLIAVSTSNNKSKDGASKWASRHSDPVRQTHRHKQHKHTVDVLSTTSSPKTKKRRRDRKTKDAKNNVDRVNGTSRKHGGKRDRPKDSSQKDAKKKRRLKIIGGTIQQDDPAFPTTESSSLSPVTSSSWTYQVSGRGNVDPESLTPQIHHAASSSLDSENENATDDNDIEEDDKPQVVSPSTADSNYRKEFFHPTPHSMQIGLRLYVSESTSNCLQCPADRLVVAKKGMKCGLFVFSALLPCTSNDEGTGIRLISRTRRVRRVLPEGSHTIVLRIIKGQPNAQRTNLQTCIFKYTVRVNRCEIPTPFPNGALNCSQGRAWGSRCTFRCNHDYVLKGADSTVCNGDDSGVEWKPAVPRCVATHCPQPGNFANGFHKCTFHRDGDSDRYPTGIVCHRKCHEGFVLPTSLLNYESITCMGPDWTHNGHNVECRKRSPPKPKPGHCTAQKLEADKHGFAFVPKAEFTSDDEKRESEVVCALEGPLAPGIYENVCEATDPELTTTQLCRYPVQVVGASCSSPPGIPLGSVQCPPTAFAPGTICHYVCSDHHVIPTSQLDIKAVTCREDQTWNNTKIPECKRQIAPDLLPASCDDYSTLARNPSQVVLPIPKFLTSSGADAATTCNNSQVTDSKLQFVNFCTATDLELRTHSTCSYAVDIKVVSCEALSAPVNGKMSCSLEGDTYRCDVKCLDAHHFASSFELPRGYVQCNLESGLWDFQMKYRGITEIPDCLREMYTSLKTDLHFNVSTIYNCYDEDAVHLLQQNIRQHLLDRNRVICDQVDCTDLTYLCFHMLSNESSIVETVWNVMANYSIDEEYDEYDGEKEELEAEFLLEKIQGETHKLVTSDEEFHEDLLIRGATVIKESFYQSKINLVCAEPGFFVDLNSFYCLECPRGTYFLNHACLPCPENTYQDEMGKLSCKPCPAGTETERGTKSKSKCLSLEPDDSDPCVSNRCQHGATCFNDNGNLLCICSTGFKGDLCEDGCPPDFCHNGGTCYSDKGTFQCLCNDRYTGAHCEETADHALLSDGRSVAISVHSRPNSPAYGAWRLHPCITNPCHVGSTCIPVAAQPYYHCQCPTGRTGPHCEHRQCPFAYQNFCYNGATCAVMAETQAWVCLCRKGFMGPRCEIRDDSGNGHHETQPKQIHRHTLPLHSTQGKLQRRVHRR